MAALKWTIILVPFIREGCLHNTAIGAKARILQIKMRLASFIATHVKK